MQCEKCKTNLDYDSKFCNKCGNKIEDNSLASKIEYNCKMLGNFMDCMEKDGASRLLIEI